MQILDKLHSIQAQFLEHEKKLDTIKEEKRKLREETLSASLNMKIPPFEIPDSQ